MARPMVTRIEVDGLFGSESYVVEVPYVEGQPSRLILLHGRNGSGKTTILRLLWNLLSAAESKGHRTYLSQTPFRRFAVEFSNGDLIAVQKRNGLLGAFSIEFGPSGSLKAVLFEVDEDLAVRPSSVPSAYRRDLAMRLGTITGPTQDADFYRAVLSQLTSEGDATTERDYYQHIRGLVGTPLLLSDDRTLESDDPHIEQWRDRYRDKPGVFRREALKNVALLELHVSLRRVNDRLREMALSSQESGASDSEALYLEMLSRLTHDAPMDASSIEVLVNTALELGIRSENLARYRLAPKFAPGMVVEPLHNTRSGDQRLMVAKAVETFLEGLRARYSGLEVVYREIDALVGAVNRFFWGKRASFSPADGLRVRAKSGDLLELENLSSGERHMLSLLLNSVLASASTGLFLIDEPELSLGVEWQREVVGALLELTEGSSTQFIIATHSIEIASANPESVSSLSTKP